MLSKMPCIQWMARVRAKRRSCPKNLMCGFTVVITMCLEQYTIVLSNPALRPGQSTVKFSGKDSTLVTRVKNWARASIRLFVELIPAELLGTHSQIKTIKTINKNKINIRSFVLPPFWWHERSFSQRKLFIPHTLMPAFARLHSLSHLCVPLSLKNSSKY